MQPRISLDIKKLLGFRLGSRHAAGSKIGQVKPTIKK